MDLHAAALCDRYGEALRICAPLFCDDGGLTRFAGAVATVKCFEDNSQVKAALAEPRGGQGAGGGAGGSLRCAMLGDRLAASAVQNGWAGVLMNGCIRDSATLAGMDLGIQALGRVPRESEPRGEGQRDIPVTFAGVTFRPGDWVYCDEDGVLAAAGPLT